MSGPFRAAAALLAFLTLSSCSYVYVVQAVILDGALAFVSEEANESSWCWGGITVFDAEGRPVRAFERRPGFDPSGDCPPKFPLVYGQVPEDAELLVAFRDGGALTMRLDGRETAIAAIDSKEREQVRRFFELCG